MPEGDTVHLAATRMHAALAGRELVRTDFRVPRYATLDLSGRRVEEVVSRGKHMLLRIAGGVTIHTHYRMDGAWHLYRHGERWRGLGVHVRAVLENSAWQAVGFRLPVLDVLPTEREAEVIGHLGPDPLAPDWDADEALRRLLADPQRPLSEALLDQRVIAGIGNVYRCEICFLRGVDPWTPVGAVRDPAAMVGLVKRLFEANRKIGSQITTGDLRPGQERYVYARGGAPCRRCRSPISRKAAAEGPDGERVTYWCPHCQPRFG
jgi:endonuclease-8